MNKIIIIGRLGKDAELRHTPNGHAVAKFSVATVEAWKDKSGEKKEQTTWHQCVLWGKGAEVLTKYLLKGTQVSIEGKIQHSMYEKDGQKKYVTEVLVGNVELLGSATKAERNVNPEKNTDKEPFQSDGIPW